MSRHTILMCGKTQPIRRQFLWLFCTEAGGDDVGAADVLPHGVAYVGPAAAAVQTPAEQNASSSSPRTGSLDCR